MERREGLPDLYLLHRIKQTEDASSAWCICMLILCLLFTLPGKAQESPVYNFNMQNGLPSNHVYMTTVDKWGYMWMATEKGVVKYNGYSLKIFDYDTGLEGEDTYGLQLDSMQRVWLYNFTGKLGYIRNDKYRRPVNNKNFLFHRIFKMTPYRDGILLATGDGTFAVSGDSVFNVIRVPAVSNAGPYLFRMGIDTLIKFRIEDYTITPKSICQNPIDRWSMMLPLGPYAVIHSKARGDVYAIDSRNCNSTTIKFYNENGIEDTVMHITYGKPGILVVVSPRNTYELDSALRLRRYAIKQLSGTDAPLVVTQMIDNSFWGKGVTTRYNGIFIKYPSLSTWKTYDKFDLHGYLPVGTIGDTAAFWWDRLHFILAEISNNGKVRTKRMPEVYPAADIYPYYNNSYLLTSGAGLFRINSTTLEIEQAIKHFHVTYSDGRKQQFDITHLAVLPIDSTHIYINSYNLVLASISRGATNMEATETDVDRYRYNLYDSSSKTIFAYGFNQLLLYRTQTGKKIKIPFSLLEQNGVQGIQRMYFDQQYGNVFIQCNNALYMLYPGKLRIKRLLSRFNLSGALIYTQRGRLVVAGRFGVAVLNIEGADRLSAPSLYRNLRDRYYTLALGGSLAGNTFLLNTNRGAYQLDLAVPEYAPGDVYKYMLLGKYEDSVYHIRHGDTLVTTQSNSRIQFDIVNPYGNGTPKVQYRDDDNKDWIGLNGNEMVIPSSVKPGKYYKIYLRFSDAARQGDPVPVYLYIQPYWWQTSAGKQVIWIGSSVALIALLAGVFLFTRSVINKNNKKRNRMLELEIKSVYAQINPHFIFNSLNSALTLIELDRNEDAHRHITRFSGLLRSFLKSSRNRYVSMVEEIVNLRNYIELQQTRFSGKFTYSITVDDHIEPATVNIPSLLLQPVVENAINHGLLPAPHVGHLSIAFLAGNTNKEVICVIEDNGVGREHSRIAAEKRDAPRISYGQVLISDLVDIFNKYEDMKINIEYIDKKGPETGLIVRLTFKKTG